MTLEARFHEIIHFWFDEIEPEMHFKKNPDFDQMIIERFSDIHRRAAACELFTWRESAEGALAEIIILDQFSRNMFRDSARAFVFDNLALALAQEAVRRKFDCDLRTERRAFLYMPYMHSESAVIHEQAVELFSQKGLDNNLKYEYRHKEIIDRFGRYPHRNAILGRESTAEEIAFLQKPGSSF